MWLSVTHKDNLKTEGIFSLHLKCSKRIEPNRQQSIHPIGGYGQPWSDLRCDQVATWTTKQRGSLNTLFVLHQKVEAKKHSKPLHQSVIIKKENARAREGLPLLGDMSNFAHI